MVANRFINFKLFIILISSAYGVSTDCQNVINLAKGLQINIVQPVIWNQIETNCCSATGVTCVNGYVTIINWSALGLNGTINSTAIPSGVLNMNIHNNALTGTLPIWPPGLQNCWLDRNQLRGTVPPFPNSIIQMQLSAQHLNGTLPTMPNGMQDLRLDGNLITGTVPSLPNSLTYLQLDNNMLSGAIPSSFPNAMTNLYLGYNQLTGTVPPFPSTLAIFTVYSNQLQGLLPVFPNSATYIDVSTNFFSGGISVNQPTTLNINNNWITNVVIQSTGQLSSCTLSYNPLLGNPNIANLTMCSKNGLYNMNLLPYTISIKQSSVPLTSKTNTSVVTRNTTYTSGASLLQPYVSTTSHYQTSLGSFQASATLQESLQIVKRTRNLHLYGSGALLLSTATESKSLDIAIEKIPLGIYGQFRAISTPMTGIQAISEGFRLVFSILIIIYISWKAPFKRELKNLFGKRTSKVAADYDDRF